MLKKILILSTACVLLVACGGKKERVVETVEYIYANNETTQSPEEKYKDKKKLFEKDSYCYYLLKFDKDAIDGVIAKIAYVNSNPENKNLKLEIVDVNVNGIHDTSKVYLSSESNGIYNIEFKYNGFWDKIDYIKIDLEANVNGRKFELESLEEGNPESTYMRVVEIDKSVIIIKDKTAYSKKEIEINSRQFLYNHIMSRYDNKNNISELAKSELIAEYGLYKISWYPDNEDIVIEQLKADSKDSVTRFDLDAALKFIDEFKEKVLPYIEPSNIEEEVE